MLDPSPRPSYRSSDFSPDIMILSAADLLEFNPAFYQAVLTVTRMARGQAAAPPTGRRLAT